VDKSLITALDSVIGLLEANIPANPESPKNVKLANALEKDIQKYFKSLEDAIPMEKLEKVYNKYVGQV